MSDIRSALRNVSSTMIQYWEQKELHQLKNGGKWKTQSIADLAMQHRQTKGMIKEALESLVNNGTIEMRAINEDRIIIRLNYQLLM